MGYECSRSRVHKIFEPSEFNVSGVTSPIFVEFNVNASLKICRMSVLLLGSMTMVAGAVLAQSAAPVALLPGAWSNNYRVTLNGKNSADIMKRVQADMIRLLPVAMQDQAKAALNVNNTHGQTTNCLSAATVAANDTPAKMFTLLSKMNPKCSFSPLTATATTQAFAGRCDDPMSFTGNVQGVLTMAAPLSWKSTFSGVGRVPDAALVALGLPAQTNVQMQSASNSRWVSATCAAPVVAVAVVK